MINLLPAKIKKEQKLKQISGQVSLAAFTLIIMIGMAYSAVYLVDYFLSGQIEKNNALLDKTKIEIATLKTIEDDINSINAKLGKLNTLKTQRYDWSSAIADINNSTPKNVQIQSILLDNKNSRVSFSAGAETRSDIVKFQAALEDLPFLKNMSFDSSNFNETGGYYTFNMMGTIGK